MISQKHNLLFFNSYHNMTLTTLLQINNQNLIMHRIRVRKQIQDFQKNPIEGIELLDCDSEFNSATFTLSGPIDTPYEGYWFKVFVQWKGYPYSAPEITLLNKIWNPYVDFQKGSICVDIINKNFSPALTTNKILLSIISLMGESKITENHEGFANPKAASQMMNNYPFFCQQARKFCESHSFKRQHIYKDFQRGMAEEHIINAEGDELKELVEKQSKDPKMLKQFKRDF